MQPWLGSDTGIDGCPSRSAGDHFVQLTAKGLSRELGYVGYYGEVLDWATQIYDATRPAPGQPGDPKIKDQLAKIARARAAFRYPALDADGNRAMRMETVVGWRDVHYPGDVTYAQRPSWDGSPVEAAAATLDPALVGYVQQMFADNQFFASMARSPEGRRLSRHRRPAGRPRRVRTAQGPAAQPHPPADEPGRERLRLRRRGRRRGRGQARRRHSLRLALLAGPLSASTTWPASTPSRRPSTASPPSTRRKSSTPAA